MKASRVAFFAVLVLTVVFLSSTAFGKKNEVRLGDKSPSKKSEQLIWDVNRQITGFRVEIKAGNPIINEVRFLGLSQKWLIGRYFNAGEKWEMMLPSATNVGQLRVNTDKARGSTFGLVVYTGNSTSSGTTTGKIVKGTTKKVSGEVDMGTRTASKKDEQIIWDVNRAIRGFRVQVLSGPIIINEVRFLGGQKWLVGRYFNAGEKFEQILSAPTNVGKLRVNTDKAKGHSIKLVIYTGTATATVVDDDDKAKSLNEGAEKKLDDLFKGFGF